MVRPGLVAKGRVAGPLWTCEITRGLSMMFGISSRQEAEAYLKHTVLGRDLRNALGL
jgi:uncharacterized protein (DUF1810 family)